MTAIAAGSAHTCALLSDTTVKCWGFNSSGELGDGSTTNASTPVVVQNAVTGAVLSGVTAIAGGADDTCILLSGGAVQCWGFNGNGSLGNGTMTDSRIPCK